MCLAIPGRLVEILDPIHYLAKVEVGGVRRTINFGLLAEEGVQIGDYVLIHIGFAMSKIDANEAEATIRFLEDLGEYQNDSSTPEEIDSFEVSHEIHR